MGDTRSDSLEAPPAPELWGRALGESSGGNELNKDTAKVAAKRWQPKFLVTISSILIFGVQILVARGATCFKNFGFNFGLNFGCNSGCNFGCQRWLPLLGRRTLAAKLRPPLHGLGLRCLSCDPESKVLICCVASGFGWEILKTISLCGRGFLEQNAKPPMRNLPNPGSPKL